MSRALALVAALVATLLWLSPALSAPFERIGVDGAPVLALMRSSSAGVLVAAGPAGVYASRSRGATWEPVAGADVRALGCSGEMAFAGGDGARLFCVLPRPPHLACLDIRLDTLTATPCEPGATLDVGLAFVAAATRGDRYRRALGARARGARLVAVATGGTVWVGHERLGVFVREAGAKAFRPSSAGLRGLAATRLEGESAVRVTLGAPGWGASAAQTSSGLVRAGTAVCERKEDRWTCEELVPSSDGRPIEATPAREAVRGRLSEGAPAEVYAVWPNLGAPELVGARDGVYMAGSRE